jgi:hypothetical protein
MKSYLRIAHMAGALIFSTAVIQNAAEIPTIQPGGLTVHEWGTFTSVAGEDGTTIDWDVLGGNNDLPRFVNNRGYRCFKFSLTAAVRMETPVIYFYSPRALDAHVRVAFPQGLITEWYPQAEDQIDQPSRADGTGAYRLPPNLNGIDTSLKSVTGGIEWKTVKIEPNTSPVLPREGAPSHYYAARVTDAAPVTVGNQHEKFLFYRGVGRFEVPLSARLVADGKVEVANLGADPVPLVMLFENRGGKVGYRTAGAVSYATMLDPVSLNGSLPQLHRDLEGALVAQGLYRKEAQAMVETWRDSWFEEGSRLIYIVPSRTVDAILPLQVEPAPSQTARAFVGRIELITPETKRSVQDAMAANDRSVIARYGRFLDPILKRIAAENPASARQIDAFRMTVKSSFTEAACRQ